MKLNTIVAIVLIAFGLFVLAYGGFSYTKREKVLDVGPIEATTTTREHIPLSPLLGGAALVAGIAVLVLSRRRG